MSIAKHPLRKTTSLQVADEIRPSAYRELNNSSGVYSHDLRDENWILVRESCAMSSASLSRPLLYGTNGKTTTAYISYVFLHSVPHSRFYQDLINYLDISKMCWFANGIH